MLLQQRGGMAFAINQRHHVGLVDLGVGLGETMGVESLLRLPVFDQREPAWLGGGMVDVKPQAARLGPTPATGLGKEVANLGYVGGVFGGQEHSEADHENRLEMVQEPLAYHHHPRGRSRIVLATGQHPQIGRQVGSPVGK